MMWRWDIIFEERLCEESTIIEKKTMEKKFIHFHFLYYSDRCCFRSRVSPKTFLELCINHEGYMHKFFRVFLYAMLLLLFFKVYVT